jgi:hypothetical protein
LVAEPAPSVLVSAPVHPQASDGDNLHGPSFLGLSEDPKVEFNYLYEDEPPSSHAGLIAVVLLLVAAGGFLGWQWRHNGFPFNRLSAGSSSGQQASTSPAAPSQSQETTPGDKTGDKSMTGVGDVPPAPDQKTQADSSGKPTETPAPGDQSTSAPSNQVPAAATEENQTTEKTEKRAAAGPPPRVRAKSSGAKPTSARTRAAAVEPAVLATSPDADLELAGERYLYGNGLPRNCSRAESNLRTAAMHGNSKAQTVLGTMYATGHCVGRDLPTAYRWFARALHEDPRNTRISADLQVLWRQMTPQEKQLATTSGQ